MKAADALESAEVLQERVRELERQVRFERSRADRNAKVPARPVGGGLSSLAQAVKYEMPPLFAVCRENEATRTAAGRPGWDAAEWDRFIAAARDPKAVAAKGGLVDKLIGTAMLRTVKAVEQMRRDGFSDEKIRQTLVLRKQHEGGLIDAHRAAMNERARVEAPKIARRRIVGDHDD